jgi:hypothetical protein
MTVKDHKPPSPAPRRRLGPPLARVQSRHVRTLPKRLRTAYAALDRDQRFAAVAAVGLLAAMFLPWYEKNVVIAGSKSFVSDSISAFGAVSFVEAAIFLVAAGVIALLLARADERPFHLPGGDGTVIFAAGLWATALIFYRVFDRPDVSGDGGTVGIQWGFFVAFMAAGALAFAGQRIRVAGRPEPRLAAAEPEPAPPPAPGSAEARSRARARSRVRDDIQTAVVDRSDARTEVVARPDRAVRREDAQQLTFDAPADDDEPDDEPPLRPGEIPRARDEA